MAQMYKSVLRETALMLFEIIPWNLQTNRTTKCVLNDEFTMAKDALQK